MEYVLRLKCHIYDSFATLTCLQVDFNASQEISSTADMRADEVIAAKDGGLPLPQLDISTEKKSDNHIDLQSDDIFFKF